MMTSNHDKFLSHLDESNAAVVHAAKWIANHGFDVEIPDLSKAENHADWKNHADSGDLFIRHRVEVKRLSVDFTCAADWPFGEDFIVCAKHSWDRAKFKPYRYVIFNRAMTHAAVVEGAIHRTWTTKTRIDSRYKGSEAVQKFYFCPIEKVKFGVVNV